MIYSPQKAHIDDEKSKCSNDTPKNAPAGYDDYYQIRDKRAKLSKGKSNGISCRGLQIFQRIPWYHQIIHQECQNTTKNPQT